MQLDRVLQLYHLGYHGGHRPSSIREPQVESETTITVQHSSLLVAAAILASAKPYGLDMLVVLGLCCIWQGLSPVLMPLPGLAPVSPYFGLRPVGRLSLPK